MKKRLENINKILVKRNCAPIVERNGEFGIKGTKEHNHTVLYKTLLSHVLCTAYNKQTFDELVEIKELPKFMLGDLVKWVECEENKHLDTQSTHEITSCKISATNGGFVYTTSEYRPKDAQSTNFGMALQHYLEKVGVACSLTIPILGTKYSELHARKVYDLLVSEARKIKMPNNHQLREESTCCSWWDGFARGDVFVIINSNEPKGSINPRQIRAEVKVNLNSNNGEYSAVLHMAHGIPNIGTSVELFDIFNVSRFVTGKSYENVIKKSTKIIKLLMERVVDEKSTQTSHEINVNKSIKMPMKFDSIEEGFVAVQDVYFNCDVSEGELADFLVNYSDIEFDKSVSVKTYMGAIQAFRQWDYSTESGDNVLEEYGAEIECEIGRDFQDYMYEDGTFVPQGTRVGVEFDIPGTSLILDDGIFIASRQREASEILAENTTWYKNKQVDVNEELIDLNDGDTVVVHYYASGDEMLIEHFETIQNGYRKAEIESIDLESWMAYFKSFPYGVSLNHVELSKAS